MFPDNFGKIGEMQFEKIRFKYFFKIQFNSRYNRQIAKILTALDRSHDPLSTTPTR